MLILATLNYGKAQITQSWELLQLGERSFIVLHESEDGSIVVPLQNSLIKDMSAGIKLEKFYDGKLNAADAIQFKNE